MRQMSLFTASSAFLVLLLHYCFPKNVEVRFVCAQAQHNQICISTVNAMRGVSIVSRLCSLRPNEVQNLVFSLSWHTCIGEDDLDMRPPTVVVHSLDDVQLQSFAQVVHEVCAWSDDI